MTSRSPSCEPESIRCVSEVAASLIATVESDNFLPALTAGVRRMVEFDNFIVFAYRQGFAAELVHSNLDLAHLGAQMKPYIDGLYLLDPFHVADVSHHRHGLLALRDVAPEDFEASEFYLTFYAAVDVLDELHFVVPVGDDRSVHAFVERERPHAAFARTEIARLEALAPLVDASLRRHWAWRDRLRASEQSLRIGSAGGIDGVIHNMGSGQLTRREAEVIGLLLQGHSSKLIARGLGISEGTVTNHKRNVYEKLAIHSQAQLFSRFLKAMST